MALILAEMQRTQVGRSKIIASAGEVPPRVGGANENPGRHGYVDCARARIALGGDKKGDERKAFVSECLKAGSPAAPMTQQDKMKVYNTKAGDKKGEERKTFMSECLKADKKS